MMKKIEIELTEEQYKILEKLCEKDKITVPVFIKMMLEMTFKTMGL